MRISSAFPSDYLKASDLQGHDVTVTMAHVSMEKVGNDQKPILYFRGTNKGLVLNKTNASKISEMYGDDTEKWTGGKIVLYETVVDYRGDPVAAIRVKLTPIVPQTNNTQVETKAQPPSFAIVDDDIPF